MSRHVALLGSVNVGGNGLKMAALKAALEEEGFVRVATVVASGNVQFEHARAGDAGLAAEIEAILRKRFGFASFAAVRTRAEITRAIAGNPFAADGEAKYVHTLFLEHPVDPAAVANFAAGFDGPERIAGGGREVHIDYASGVARSQVDPALRRAKLFAGRATARNIRSLARILENMDR